MATLKASLESVRLQSYSNCEVLLLDNATLPDARAVLEEYSQADSRVRILRSPTRISMFENFQRGVNAAVGRYLTFFHDDDVYAEDFVIQQVKLMEAHPEAAFAGGNCTVIDASGRSIADRVLIRRTEVWSGWRYICTIFSLGNNIFPMQSIMFRRELLGPETFDPSSGVHFTDYLILMRLAENHDVGLVKERLLRLREHDDQASQKLSAVAGLQLRTQLFLNYADELSARWPGRAPEIEDLRRRIAPARRSAALWMWLNATNAQRAADARSALDGPGPNAWLRSVLSFADRSGLSGAIRNSRVRRRLRSVAYRIAGRSRS